MSSGRSAGPILDSVRRVRCALAERAVWSMGVVVLDVLVEKLSELSVVPDERPVAKFTSDRADLSVPNMQTGVVTCGFARL